MTDNSDFFDWCRRQCNTPQDQEQLKYIQGAGGTYDLKDVTRVFMIDDDNGIYGSHHVNGVKMVMRDGGKTLEIICK